MSPETGIEHLRNVLQALAQPTHTVEPFVLLLTPMEVAAMVVRIKAALRELENGEVARLRGLIEDAQGVDGVDADDAPLIVDAVPPANAWVQGYEAGQESILKVLDPAGPEYVVDVVQGARMDGASLPGQEPE